MGVNWQPDPIDLHVGQRVRMRRKVCGMSQDRLARALGVTFQQVQKYEKGSNRIACSTLTRIAAALGEHPAWFFYGVAGTHADAASSEEHELVTRMLTNHGGVELARRFVGMTSVQRAQLLNVVRAIGVVIDDDKAVAA